MIIWLKSNYGLSTWNGKINSVCTNTSSYISPDYNSTRTNCYNQLGSSISYHRFRFYIHVFIRAYPWVIWNFHILPCLCVIQCVHFPFILLPKLLKSRILSEIIGNEPCNNAARSCFSCKYAHIYHLSMIFTRGHSYLNNRSLLF